MNVLRPARTRGLPLGVAVLCVALLGAPASEIAELAALTPTAPPGWEGPHAATLELAGAPAPVADSVLRPSARAFVARVAPDPERHSRPCGSIRVVERDVHEHPSPLVRWRLAHSTSSGVD